MPRDEAPAAVAFPFHGGEACATAQVTDRTIHFLARVADRLADLSRHQSGPGFALQLHDLRPGFDQSCAFRNRRRAPGYAGIARRLDGAGDQCGIGDWDPGQPPCRIAGIEDIPGGKRRRVYPGPGDMGGRHVGRCVAVAVGRVSADHGENPGDGQHASGASVQPLPRDQIMLSIGRGHALGGKQHRIALLVGISGGSANAAMGVEPRQHHCVDAALAQQGIQSPGFETAEVMFFHDLFAVSGGQRWRRHRSRRAAQALPHALPLPMRHPVGAIFRDQGPHVDHRQQGGAESGQQRADLRGQIIPFGVEAGPIQKIVLDVDQDQGLSHAVSAQSRSAAAAAMRSPSSRVPITRDVEEAMSGVRQPCPSTIAIAASMAEASRCQPKLSRSIMASE
jgi:hypothetical protein